MITETANAASRRAILALADSPRLDHLVRRHGMRLGAGRVVAGETLDQLVPVLRRLDDLGLLTNTTLLGEGIRSPEEAGAVVVAYREILDRIRAEGLHGRCQEFVIGDVAGQELDGPAGDLLPSAEPLRDAPDGRQCLHAQIQIPLPPGKIVDDPNPMAARRQKEGRCPSTVTVASEDQYLHGSTVAPKRKTTYQ